MLVLACCDVCGHDKPTHEWGEGRCRECNCKKFAVNGGMKKEIKMLNSVTEDNAIIMDKITEGKSPNFGKITTLLEVIFDLDWETEVEVIKKVMDKIKKELAE